MIALPITVLIASFLSPWVREKTVAAISTSVDVCVYAALVYILWPSRAPHFFEVRSLQLSCARLSVEQFVVTGLSLISASILSPLRARKRCCASKTSQPKSFNPSAHADYKLILSNVRRVFQYMSSSCSSICESCANACTTSSVHASEASGSWKLVSAFSMSSYNA